MLDITVKKNVLSLIQEQLKLGKELIDVLSGKDFTLNAKHNNYIMDYEDD